MSIVLEVVDRCAPHDGRLVPVVHRLGLPPKRRMYLTRELHDAIAAGLLNDAADTPAYRIGQLVNDLDVFVEGRLITVGYGQEKTCFLKRLDPERDEVWEIRSRDPEPAVRVFGSFIEKDSFLATNFALRPELGGYKDRRWQEEMKRCRAEWRKVLPTYEPLRGSKLDEYVSNCVEVEKIP